MIYTTNTSKKEEKKMNELLEIKDQENIEKRIFAIRGSNIAL